MDLEVLKSIVEHSNKVNDIAFKLLIATFAIVLTTSYIKPVSKKWKLIYLLFLPGWIFIYFSINNNDQLNRRSIMFQMTFKDIENIQKNNVSIKSDSVNNIIENKIENIEQTIKNINSNLSSQLDNFRYSLLTFGLWLFTYLFWWIFFDRKENNEK